MKLLDHELCRHPARISLPEQKTAVAGQCGEGTCKIEARTGAGKDPRS